MLIILERHVSLWSITLEVDIVFAGAGGGISGGCFELTEPALIVRGYHSEVCVKSSWPSAGLPFRDDVLPHPSMWPDR